MSEIQDYAATISISSRLLAEPDAEPYIQEQIELMEKDAIYKAVKQVEKENGWICIRPELVHQDNWMYDLVEYSVRVHCRPVLTERVYIPIFERQSMPIDVFECKWCGGYTKNDYLGHCAACGGPRDLSYIEKLRDGRI